MKKKRYGVDLVYRGYDPTFELAVMEVAKKNKLNVCFYYWCLPQDSVIHISMIGAKKTFNQKLTNLTKALRNKRFNRKRKTFQLWDSP